MRVIQFLLLLMLLSPASAFSGEFKRIISLTPGLTEILFALGVGERIVGVTQYSDYPPEAKEIPKVGGMATPSIERILRLKPDLVVLSVDGNPKEIKKRLDNIGIKTYVFKARRLKELSAEIRRLGSFLSVTPKAEKLASAIDKEIERYRKLKHKRLKVLFIIWPQPLILAGHGTAIDDVLKIFGLENIANKTKIPYPKYSLEDVIRQDPDIIFIGKGHQDMVKLSAQLLEKLKSTKAVKNGRIYYVSDALYRLGPRIVDGMRELSGYLR